MNPGQQVNHGSSLLFARRDRRKHNTPSQSITLTFMLCLILTLGPSVFAPLSHPSPLQVTLCSAAPILWTPLTEVLGSLFRRPQLHNNSTTDANTVPTPSTKHVNDDHSSSRIVTANDFGIVQLDLEGDPNCDYTTKVRVAGSEYNVIIDTGSAHFAIASSACRDCMIPHKDHYRYNEEEEIPIDRDANLQNGVSSSYHGNIPASSGLGILNLLKNHRSHRSYPSSRSSTHQPSISPYLSTVTSSLTEFQKKAPVALATPISHSAPLSKEPLYMEAPSIIAHTSIHWCRPSSHMDHFLRHRPQLQNMQTSLQHLKDSSPTPSTNSASRSLDNHLANSAAGSSSMSQPVAISATMPTNKFRLERRKRRLQRDLAAAPAENLYPLSDPTHKKGQSVRVSYGIKSHSVGWSGVMTSDLMTLHMAKIVQTRTGANVAKPNVTMEKETNVEFAAIVENNGFFSQECGAQHGIWGLGYRSLSVDRKPTLFDTLSATMKIPNGFALQLCGRKSNTTKTGNMFLGGYSSTHLAEPMQFVPLVKKDWYQVQLDGFKVMGDPVQGMQNLNMPKTIVDSGTTNILMSHYNLQFLIRSLAQSEVVRWSSLIPEQDISNFWFRNAVLRLPRSSFQVSTAAQSVEVVLSGISIPIYTSSFLRIKSVPAGQAPSGYVDFWWHGFASSTSPDAIEVEQASGGAVTPGSVGTILGETLFAGKVVFFDRGVDGTEPGDPDYGRIGFARGQNCFASADHMSVNVLANEGKAVDLEGLRPVRVAATSGANIISGSSDGDMDGAGKTQPPGSSPPFRGFSGPIRLMGSASNPFKSHSLVCRMVGGLAVAIFADMI